jgi:DNA-directed RNA polymerase
MSRFLLASVNRIVGRRFNFSTLTNAQISGLNEQNMSSRPIEELFPAIASLIESQEHSRVSEVVDFCRNKRPQDWLRALNSPAIPNMIFKSFLESFEKGQTDAVEMGAQLNILRKDLHISLQRPKASLIPHLKPDVMSFALMFKYILLNSSDLPDDSIRCDLKYLEHEALIFDISLKIILNTISQANLLDVNQMQKLHILLDIKACNTDSGDSIEALLDSHKIDRNALRSIDLPEVRTISSKSEGIAFIKDSLKQLFDLDPIALNDPATMYNLQLGLEQDCYTAMISKLRKEAEALANVTGTGNLGNIKKDLLRWLDSLKCALDREFKGRIESSSTDSDLNDSSYYMALLSVLDSEKISIIVIQELLKIALYEPFFLTVETSSGEDDELKISNSVPIKAARLVTLATNIGSALQREVFAIQVSRKSFLNRAQLNPMNLAQTFDKKRALDRSMRRVYAALEGDLEAQREGWIPAWTNGLKAELGSFLLGIVEKNLTYEEGANGVGVNVPVFSHCVVYSGNSRKLGVIRMNDEVFEKLRAEKQIVFVEAWAMPMLVPPKPWLTITSGGYLTHKSK